MIKTIIIVLAVITIIYCFHRICLWLEKNSYLYYKNKRADSSVLGGALETLNAALNPSAKYTIEMKQKQTIVEMQKAPDDNDKNSAKCGNSNHFS